MPTRRTTGPVRTTETTPPVETAAARRPNAPLKAAPNPGAARTGSTVSEETRRAMIEQAAYLRDLLAIFDDAGVDAAFVFTFAGYALPHRDAPRDDLDLASFGVVTVLEGRHGDTYPDLTWEPKAAFAALADYYRG